MKRLRNWGAVAAALSVALVAAGCSGADPDPVASDEPIEASGTVTVWVGSWWEDKAEIIQELWDRDNPGITLNLEPLPNNGYVENFTTAALAGSPPDVIDLSSRAVSSIAAQGLLESLDDLVPRLDVEDYSAGMWAASQLDGVQYAIPSRASSMVLYYNKTVFDTAGVDYPEAGWTYEDLLETAQALTVDGQFGIGISADLSDPGAAMNFFLPVIWAHGGDVLSKDLSKAATNTPEFIEGLTYWSDLYTKYHVTPDGTPNFNIPRDIIPLFQANRVGIFASDASAGDTLAQTADVQWDRVLMPDDISKATGWTMGVPVGAKNPDAGRVFLLWLSDPDIQAEVLPRPPPRTSALALPPWNDPANEIFAVAAANTRPDPPSPYWTSIEVIVLTEAQKVLVGQLTPKEAAESMEEQINNVIKG